MKTYLNRQERAEYLVLMSFSSYLEKLIERWAEIGKDKELLKFTRMSKSFADKVTGKMVEGLDETEATRVVKECLKYTILALNNDEYKRIKNDNNWVTVQAEDLKDLSDYALIVCQTCGAAGGQVIECRLRGLLMDYSIPPFDEYAQPGQCQYRIPDFHNRREVIRSLLKGA